MKDRIRELRREAGLTQVEFGKRVGISGQGVSKIENGTNQPSDRTLRLIASAFHVSLAWLTTGEGVMREAAAPNGLPMEIVRFLQAAPSIQEEAWNAMKDCIGWILAEGDAARAAAK